MLLVLQDIKLVYILQHQRVVGKIWNNIIFEYSAMRR